MNPLLTPDSTYFKPLRELLLDQQARIIDFWPNGGNWGDALLYQGAHILFNHLGLQVRNVTGPQPDGDVLIYGAGGAWCPDFRGGEKKATLAAKVYNKVIVLPSSYNQIGELPKNVILTARDAYSRDYASITMHGDAILAPDLALLVPPVEPPRIPDGHLNAWRDTNYHEQRPRLPADNIDISLAAKSPYVPVEPLLSFVAGFATVDTDRMHIGIAASIQRVPCLLRPNADSKISDFHFTWGSVLPDSTRFKNW